MNIQFLGTAAAEGIPAMFCGCEVCKKSRAAGGKNIRTRSQAIIDKKLLIDFPADTYIHMLLNGIELEKIHTCIITHDHSDHLYPADLEMRKSGFAHTNEAAFNMYGTYPSYRRISDALIKYKMDEQGRVNAKRIEPFVAFEAEGYKIIPLAADHDPKCDPVFYIIEKDGKSLMYAHDTGIFPEITWEYLKNNPVCFDLVSIDCTEPATGIYRGHMSLDSNKTVRKRMMEYGLANNSTKFILNHISHNGKLTYDELVPIAENEGFIVSYDGMCIEF